MTDCVCHEINSRNCPVHQNEHESPWMDVDQCAKYLGLSKETIYRHIDSGKIPVNRIGKLYRFHKEEIDIWICSDGDL